MTPEQIRAWRKIVASHDGPAEISMPRSLMQSLLDCIPEACAEEGKGLDGDQYGVRFERRDGRLLWTAGVPVVACEIVDPAGEVVAGSEVTVSPDTEAQYPELAEAYRYMALRIAADAVRLR